VQSIPADVALVASCTGPCYFAFAAVPAKKTLRITSVSCWFFVGDTGGIRLIYLSNGEAAPASVFIPGQAQGNAQYIVANAEVNLYASAGSAPLLTVDANTAAKTNGQCTISGYTVSFT
jgi:hypothetical protein